MRKIIDWLIFKDIKKKAEEQKKNIDGTAPKNAQPGNTYNALNVLTKCVINLNYSTSKYSRIIIFLTIVLAVLTVLMIFRS